jgi:hypothetical protein
MRWPWLWVALVASPSWAQPVLLPATVGPPIQLVNDTGENLPELGEWTAPALDGLPCTGLTLRILFQVVEGDNGQDYHRQLFPAGVRYQMTRTFTGANNTFTTLRISGSMDVLDPSGTVLLGRQAFTGRTRGRLYIEPWIATNRARRRAAGFLLEPARLNPWGGLFAEALANGLARARIPQWLAGFSVKQSEGEHGRPAVQP